jgi:hypothetical protein
MRKILYVQWIESELFVFLILVKLLTIIVLYCNLITTKIFSSSSYVSKCTRKKHLVLKFVSVLWHVDDFLCVLKLQSTFPRTDHTPILSTHHPCIYGQKYPLNHRLMNYFWLVPNHNFTSNQITVLLRTNWLPWKVKWWGHEYVSITHEISTINGT